MSVTQQQVLDALAQVKSPRGVALTEANVLSAIAVNDGKVFFSINVDAAEARAWEDVRTAAERAVRALPGVRPLIWAVKKEAESRKTSLVWRTPGLVTGSPGLRLPPLSVTAPTVPRPPRTPPSTRVTSLECW